MSDIRKGYCYGCPYDYGSEGTEMAYNYGCLPTVADIHAMTANTAWACHSEPEKVCCGFAAHETEKISLPLLHVEGVHARRPAP